MGRTGTRRCELETYGVYGHQARRASITGSLERSHNPKVSGSNPTPAAKKTPGTDRSRGSSSALVIGSGVQKSLATLSIPPRFVDMPNADQRPRCLRTNKSCSDSRESTTCPVEDIARQSGENRCRGQTAVKHAKRSPHVKWEPGFKPIGPENRHSAGSWVMNSGKQRQLSDIGASLIRMRSLVQIQVGPPPRTPSPSGFSPFHHLLRHRFEATAVKRSVKHAKHLPRRQPPQSRSLTPAEWRHTAASNRVQRPIHNGTQDGACRR
jgi:hypothetical protein